jgi:hypothetical protein
MSTLYKILITGISSKSFLLKFAAATAIKKDTFARSMELSLFNILDLLGTVAFAISGALAAMNRKLDLFGIFIIAFVTSIGGGTLKGHIAGPNPYLDGKYHLHLFYWGGNCSGHYLQK